MSNSEFYYPDSPTEEELAQFSTFSNNYLEDNQLFLSLAWIFIILRFFLKMNNFIKEPYNKLLIKLIGSVRTGELLPLVFKHKPRCARSVLKTAGNNSPVRTSHSFNK